MDKTIGQLMTDQEKQKKAIIVLLAGVFFNLTIQVLYVWSLLRAKMLRPVADGGWGWEATQAGLPFTLVLVFFSIGVFIGGRVQDKIGPRPVASVGGAFVGLGLVISGLLGNNPMGVAISFGVITGLGIGWGYTSVLAAALKWFHPSRKGFVSGMVLGGFGLASVHFAPITSTLLGNFDIERTFLFLGTAIAILSVLIAQFVKNPPAGYIPPQAKNAKPAAAKVNAPIDFTYTEMVKTKRFYLIFVLFAFSCSIGLMMIGNIAVIADRQASFGVGAFLVAYVAIMNAAGRIIGGMTSDKIGRENTLFIVITLQMINMLVFRYYGSTALIILGFTFVGLCFGAFLAIFPALTADQFGLKNYGVNYGIVYFAYAIGGILAPLTADILFQAQGSFYTVYLICAAMMVMAICINFLLKREIVSLRRCL